MARRDSWICLMYHEVLSATAAEGGGPERFAVPIQSFELMLDIVRELGFEGCSLARAVSGLVPRPVAITFDDGTISQFEHAFPALVSRGMTATFFVTTDWVGKPGFMSWDQLRQMVANGMSIQSHTKSHPFLSELGRERLLVELQESKSELDAQLSQDTTELSLPGGDAPRRRLRPMLREAGYSVVAGSRWGRNPVNVEASTASLVRRCTMRGDLDREYARAVLASGPRITLSRYPREVLLNGVRSLLGPSRYAHYRRQLLDALSGSAKGR